MQAAFFNPGVPLAYRASILLPNARRASRWEMVDHQPGWAIRSSGGQIADSVTYSDSLPVGDQPKTASPSVQGTGGAIVLTPDTERCKKNRRVGAVFFDMDDTLVLTHEADRAAYKAVQAVVASRMPLLDTNAIIEVFRGAFTVQAWDPDHQVSGTLPVLLDLWMK